MASIAKRPDGSWRVRYTDPTGRERAKHFGRRKFDGQRLLDQVTAALQTGHYVDPAFGKTTVGELAVIWLAGKINLKPTTGARYEDVLNTHVLPHWANVPVVKIEYGRRAGLACGPHPARSGRHLSPQGERVLSGILGLAVKDRRIPNNPALGVACHR